MGKARSNRWKKVCAMLLAAAMAITMMPVNAMAGTSSDLGNGTFQNPVIYSDVPDLDMIRVGDAYYMISTTMHLSPGCPVMKSTDLVNWEIVNYVFDRLGTEDAMSLRNGKSMYGNGQWASSLQYHDGVYYVAFNSNTTGRAYIFTTNDIEGGSWTKQELDAAYHDMALFFDDNGKTYILYGGTQIRCVELKEDLSGAKEGSEVILFDSNAAGEKVNASGKGFILGYEGTHILKKDGYYYVFNICWPNGAGRTEVCHRSKTFPTTEWENEVILQANFSNFGTTAGVAQGGVIDTQDGKWYGFLFQDHGAVGRVPVLTDCTWKDGWPMLGKDGDGKTVEAVMELPISGSSVKSIVKSDEFYNDAEHREFAASASGQEQGAGEGAAAVSNEASMAGAAAEPIAGAAAEPMAEDEPQTETVELMTNGNFENGEEGWQGFEDGTVAVVAEDGSENHVAAVTGRQNTSSSAMQDLSGKLEKGRAYKITGRLKYDIGPDTKEFHVMLQNGVDYRYRSQAGVIQAKKGEWTEFSIDYTAGDKVDGGNTYPFSTTQNYFFIETPWKGQPTAEEDLMDYYLDDISMTYEKKAGEEEEPKPDPGDGSLVEVIENGGFETGDATGWQMTRTESGELEVVTDEKASGDYSIHAFNRKNCGAGPCQNISGRLKRGKTYTISGKIKYTTGPDTKQFYVTIENGDNYNWRENLVSIHARKGEWTSFSGTYTVHDKSEQFPFDPNQNYIFVETPWAASPSAENDLMDFYLDDFSMTTESDNMIQNGSFENGIEPWTGMENASVSVTEEEAQDGAASAVTTGRTACAQGPCQDLSNKMTPGNIYTITAYIKYKTGADSKAFNMTIQNGPDYNYRTILGSVTAAKGEWTKLEVTYTMPEDAISTQNYLFFETPWVANPTAENDLMDFYVDNVTMTEQVPDKKVEEAGENDYNGSNLDLVWQWNHNPNNNYWSLTERSGWLRLTAGSKASSILEARNTLTQRTYGPTCSGKVKMDISNMKAGDVAGLASFSYNYGYIAVKKEASGAKLVMVDASSNSVKGKDEPEEKASVDCEGDIVYLKEDFDFAGGDKVGFYYSFDGDNWQQLGTDMKLTYELTHFMGSRFALFHYATRSSGGYVDFDYFRVSDQITGADHGSSAGKAELSNAGEVSGVINSTCEVKMTLDPLPAEGHSSLKASISIPDIMEVEDVAFQESAIQGKADYSCKSGRLTLSVKGDNVSFQAADRLFATIKLKLKNYVDQDTAASLKADYVMVDKGAMEYDVSGCATTVNLKYLDTGALAKKLGYGNPLMTQEFGADPYAIVYDGRVYVYMTADDYQYDANGEIIENNYGYIRSLRVISSDDMMNWTDHGEIKVAGEDGAAKWAAHSWAPAIAYKQIEGKDKFFLYFANDASGIGVLEADTPLGPWKDPIGKALITRQTPGCQDVVWCFDPAVLVDDDGSAYIYFGGGVPDGQQINPKTARVAKLGADMISIDGEAKLIDAPCMFEDSGIFKYNGKYYYNYCTNFISPHGDGGPGYGTICYMESDDPMGPYTYKGEIFQNPANWFGVGGNNHHATFVFEGRSYFIYHAQTVSKEQGVQKGYRSTHIDKIEFYGDGSIKPIKGTYAGIPQLREISAFDRIEAETIAWNKGIKVSQCSVAGGKFNEFNRQLTDLQDGDWAAVSQVSFGEKGARSFTANVASEKGGKIEIRLDSPQGALIGTLNVEATGSENTFKALECSVDQVTGTRNVFFVFRGTASGNLMNVDYYQFHEKATEPGPAPADTSKLSAKITEAEDLLGKLSAEFKDELQAAIQAAKGILEKENASQEEVDAALAALSKTVEEKKKEQEDKEQKEKDQKAAKAVTEKISAIGTVALTEACKAKIEDARKAYDSLTETQKKLVENYGTLTAAEKKYAELAEQPPTPEKYSLQKAKIAAIPAQAYTGKAKKPSITLTYGSKKLVKGKDYVVSYKNNIKIGTATVTATGKGDYTGSISRKFTITVKKNAVYTVGNYKYKVTSAKTNGKGTVALTGVKSSALKKKLTKGVVADTVKIGGKKFQVTAIGSKAFQGCKKLSSVSIGKYVKTIGKQAFYQCKKLKKITIKGTALKSVGKNALKGIYSNAVILCPKKQMAKYKKLCKASTGFKKTMKWKAGK